MNNRPVLEKAFRATTYHVQAGGECFDLRLDVVHPAFSRWLLDQGVSHWGIVTACNPGGKPTPKENVLRMAELREKIMRNGWRHVPACNRADAGDWPDEAGFCVLAVGCQDLCALARGFCQTAIVCGRDDGQGCLVWLDGEIK